MPLAKAEPWVPHMRDNKNLTSRVETILNLVAVQHLGLQNLDAEFTTKKKLLRDVFCDVSQNPKFGAFTGSSGNAPCLATSTRMFSFGEDRWVLPIELLYWQGHSRGIRIPEGMKSNEIRDLAGEGMCLPCFGTVLWSAFLASNWP